MFLVCNGYLVRGLVCLSHWSKMAFVVLRAKTTSNWQWITVTHHFLRMCQWIQLRTRFLHGYGSIPINTNFRGMNIHLPAILMFTRGTRFWHTATYEFFCLLNPMIFPHDSPWFHHGPSVPSRAARAMPGTWPSACGAARLELTRKRRTKPWEDGEFMGNSWRFHGDFSIFGCQNMQRIHGFARKRISKWWIIPIPVYCGAVESIDFRSKLIQDRECLKTKANLCGLTNEKMDRMDRHASYC